MLLYYTRSSSDLWRVLVKATFVTQTLTECTYSMVNHTMSCSTVQCSTWCRSRCGSHADSRGRRLDRGRTRSGGARPPCLVVRSALEPEPDREVVLHTLRETPRVHQEHGPGPAARQGRKGDINLCMVGAAPQSGPDVGPLRGDLSETHRAVGPTH